MKMKLLLYSICLLFACSGFSSFSSECNEKIRQVLVASATKKCSQKFTDLFWSEKEVDAVSDGSGIAAAFSFKCKVGKRYIGIVKTSGAEKCEVSEPSISHTSLVPLMPIK